MENIKNTPVIFSDALAKNDKILKIYKQTTFSMAEFQNIYKQLLDIKSRGDRYHILKIQSINFEKLDKNRKQIDELNSLIQGNKCILKN